MIREAEVLDVVVEIVTQAPGDPFGSLRCQGCASERKTAFEQCQGDKTKGDVG